MNKVLIIEDDLDINNLIKESLQKHDYICTQAFSGTEGLLHTNMKEFNLIILDLMLPGISGEEFIEKLTNEKNTPILVASTLESINYRGMVLNKELFDISIDGSLLNLTRQEYKIIKLLLEKLKIEINLFV